MPFLHRAIILLAIVVASCGGGSDVEVGPGGELLMGAERASALDARGVDLAGRRLVLDGFAGTVRVIGIAAGAPARINFERVARGRTAVAAQQGLERLTIDEAGDAESYTYSMNTPRREGAEVNVEAQIPRDASLTIRLDAGAIHLDALVGDVEATLQAGPIRAAGLAGREVRLRTESGAIEVGAAAVPEGAEWSVGTSAGTVILTLPAGVAAEIDAETGTGTIRVDGLDFSNRSLNREAAGMEFSGRLGEGGGRIEVRTEVGTIRLAAALPEPAVAPERAGGTAPPAR